MLALPGIDIDEIVNEICSQTSAPMGLPDEDWVNDVQTVAPETSCSRHRPSFPLESTEAHWVSLHPAQQHLTVWDDWTRGLLTTRLHSRCPRCPAGRSLTRSGGRPGARWDSRLRCSARTAATARAQSRQLSNHWTPPGNKWCLARCEVRWSCLPTSLWRISLMSNQPGLLWTAGQYWQVLQTKPFSHLWSLTSQHAMYYLLGL